MRCLGTHTVLQLGALLLLAACGAGNEPPRTEPGGADGAAANDGTNDAGATNLGTDGGDSSSSVVAGRTCATVSTNVGLLPVHLAFAFDVSGSMGKGDKEWHDKQLKWAPVAAATRSFFEASAGSFEAPVASGVLASLTFFPAEGDEDERCVESAYTTPDVPFTALPSAVFGAAIDAIEPRSSDDWRGGTPTKWVMRGTRTLIEQTRAERPGSYAIVLVTDGYPQGCDEADDSVEAVVTEAQAALATGVRTYVIGVANPPVSGAPDTVTDLHAIAAAGATEQAFLIDTGTPTATVDAFSAAVQAIREASASCTVAIPSAPEGATFDKQKVAVLVRSGAQTTPFSYDASCTLSNAWHYDDPANPQQIVLCEQSCEQIKLNAQAMLQVQFACETLILL